MHFKQRWSYYRLRDMLALSGDRQRDPLKVERLRRWVASGYHFGVVESIESDSTSMTWDVLNSPTEAFVASGFLVHNCTDPLCIDEGVCTGTRFVPHVDQWTSNEPHLRTRRKMTPAEVVAASRTFAHKAAAQTGRDEDRTDKEILAHVKMVWMRTIQHIRSKGKWRQ
jgi:hypothetical protein